MPICFFCGSGSDIKPFVCFHEILTDPFTLGVQFSNTNLSFSITLPSGSEIPFGCFMGIAFEAQAGENLIA